MKVKPVTVTGSSLTIEDVVAVARHGAEVKLSADAKKKNQGFKENCR